MEINFDKLDDLHREIARLRADPKCPGCDGSGIYYGNVAWCPCLRRPDIPELDVIDVKLNECKDGECYTCSEIICPHGFAMHFHHDGCPACAERECQNCNGTGTVTTSSNGSGLIEAPCQNCAEREGEDNGS